MTVTSLNMKILLMLQKMKMYKIMMGMGKKPGKP